MVADATPQKIEKRLVFMGKWKRADNFDGLKWFLIMFMIKSAKISKLV